MADFHEDPKRKPFVTPHQLRLAKQRINRIAGPDAEGIILMLGIESMGKPGLENPSIEEC